MKLKFNLKSLYQSIFTDQSHQQSSLKKSSLKTLETSKTSKLTLSSLSSFSSRRGLSQKIKSSDDSNSELDTMIFYGGQNNENLKLKKRMDHHQHEEKRKEKIIHNIKLSKDQLRGPLGSTLTRILDHEFNDQLTNLTIIKQKI